MDPVEFERICQEIAEAHSQLSFSRPLTDADIHHLLEQWPFLQMVNGDYDTYGQVEFKTVQSPAGWTVHHYGDALSVSVGTHALGEREEDEGRGGQGTIVRQAVEVAKYMVQLALEKGWGSIMLVDGSRLMQWAAWMYSEELGLTCSGFEPTQAEYDKRRRALISNEDWFSFKHELRHD